VKKTYVVLDWKECPSKREKNFSLFLGPEEGHASIASWKKERQRPGEEKGFGPIEESNIYTAGSMEIFAAVRRKEKQPAAISSERQTKKEKREPLFPRTRRIHQKRKGETNLYKQDILAGKASIS